MSTTQVQIPVLNVWPPIEGAKGVSISGVLAKSGNPYWLPVKFDRNQGFRTVPAQAPTGEWVISFGKSKEGISINVEPFTREVPAGTDRRTGKTYDGYTVNGVEGKAETTVKVGTVSYPVVVTIECRTKEDGTFRFRIRGQVKAGGSASAVVTAAEAWGA
jgi:hypothetical protein